MIRLKAESVAAHIRTIAATAIANRTMGQGANCSGDLLMLARVALMAFTGKVAASTPLVGGVPVE